MFDERDALESWARAFGHVLGWAPEITGVNGALTLRFDGPIEPIEMLGNTGHIAQGEALLEHARAMGFSWDARGVVRGVPSPDTFNARAEALLPRGVGYRMRYIRCDRRNMSLGSFLLRYLEGRVPVQLGSEGYYAEATARTDPGLRGELGFHFTSFAHDLSVHALNYQIVPRALIDAIRARVEGAVPERVRAWSADDAEGPLTLTTFFDNDVNNFCYAAWSASATLREAICHAEALGDELLRCLDHRVEETRAGLGDVPSGDTADMNPLSPWAFAPRPAPREAPRDSPLSRDACAALSLALLGVREVPASLPALRARLVDVRVDGPAVTLLLGWENPVLALRVAPEGEGVATALRELHPSASRIRAGATEMAAALRASLSSARLARAVSAATSG